MDYGLMCNVIYNELLPIPGKALWQQYNPQLLLLLYYYTTTTIYYYYTTILNYIGGEIRK